jgi:hypothetical protein
VVVRDIHCEIVLLADKGIGEGVEGGINCAQGSPMHCIKYEVWLVRWLDDFIERTGVLVIGFGAQRLGLELQISVGDGGLMQSITSPVRFPYTVCVELLGNIELL